MFYWFKIVFIITFCCHKHNTAFMWINIIGIFLCNSKQSVENCF